METEEKKNIPIRRFPEFLNDGEWKKIQLGDIGQVSMCKRVMKEETSKFYSIPFYKIGTFGQKADAFISEELYNEYRLRYPFPSKGDILISAAGTIGRTVVYDGRPAYFQDSNIVWIANNEKTVYNSFLKYIYSFAKWHVDEGGVVKRLYNESIRRTVVLIPSLPEQFRIAEFLSTLDELIASVNSKSEQLKTYKKGLMQKLFPAKGKKLPELRFKEFEKDGEWEEKKLGEIVNVLDSQRKPVAKNERMRGKYPYYGANGIQDYVSDYIFDGSFLLMGEDGSVINKDGTPVLHWAEGRIWVNNHAHVMSENCNAAYLKYVFYVLSKVDVQSLVKGIPPKINQQNMRNILLLIPSLPEQEKIASCLSTLDEKINSYKEKIALLGQYKKGLMQQLFPTSK